LQDSKGSPNDACKAGLGGCENWVDGGVFDVSASTLPSKGKKLGKALEKFTSDYIAKK
jgi:hypothetical protein